MLSRGFLGGSYKFICEFVNKLPYYLCIYNRGNNLKTTLNVFIIVRGGFAVYTFAVWTLRRNKFAVWTLRRMDSSPYGQFAVGQFAVRKTRRTDFSP